MVVSQIIALVAAAMIIALLGYIARTLLTIAQLPARVDQIAAENRRAHGDLWAAITNLRNTLERL